MLKNTWKYLFSNLWDPETLFFTSSGHNKHVVTKKNHKGALAAQLCRFQKSNQTWFSWKRHYGNRIRNQKTTATPHQFPLNTSCKQRKTELSGLSEGHCTTQIAQLIAAYVWVNVKGTVWLGKYSYLQSYFHRSGV